MLEGIPLQIKHVNVTINRPNFTFNPTDCNPLKLEGTLSSAEGASRVADGPLPGNRLRGARVQTVLHGFHGGAQHPYRGREPRHEGDLPGDRTGHGGEHREGQGEPARQAAGALEHTAEGVHGKDVRRRSRGLPRRVQDRPGDHQDTGATRTR